MGRTIVGFFLVALVVAPAWANLEAGDFPTGEVMLISLLALLPTLAVALRRSPFVVAPRSQARSSRPPAFEIPLSDARRGERDLLGPMLGSLPRRLPRVLGHEGALRRRRAAGHARRRPARDLRVPRVRGDGDRGAADVPALALLLVGAGWPATMAGTSGGDDGRPLLVGALILFVALALLVLLRGGTRGSLTRS